MKIYLAGKIAGDQCAAEKFKKYEKAFKITGDVVLNPTVLPEGLTVAEYMRICFAMIDAADAVFFLADWKQSGGAQLEKAYCDYTGKPYSIQKEEKNHD